MDADGIIDTDDTYDGDDLGKAERRALDDTASFLGYATLEEYFYDLRQDPDAVRARLERHRPS